MERKIKDFGIHEGQILICPKCNSNKINKAGKRYNLYYTNQRFRCKECQYRISLSSGFKGTRHPKEIIIYSLRLIEGGMSYREASEEIERKYNYKISRQTLHRWNIKYKNHKVINHDDKTLLVIEKLKNTNFIVIKRKFLNPILMISSAHSRLKENPILKMGLISSMGGGYYYVNRELVNTLRKIKEGV